VHGRRAVREEEDLIVRLVTRLHRGAWMHCDEPTRLDVDASWRVLEEQRQDAAQRHEDLFLIRVDVPAALCMPGVAPHSRSRLRQSRRIGDDRVATRLRPGRRLTLLPVEVGRVHDVEGHAATIPSGSMARLSYPRAAEPRPAALPPGERTVGQLVAESIRMYGDRFVRCLAIGVPPAALALLTAHVSRNVALALAPTLYGAALSASYVAACVLVLERRPSNGRLLVAWAAGWLVFAPVPFLVLAFVLPGLAWLAAVGLVVPVLVVEETPARRAFARAWQLARAGYVHALGSLATLAIVVFLTQTVLAFILRGAGGTAVSTAFVLANVVISPLLFVGAALLYVDQAARVE
jgi:hypothetical protein